MDDGSILTNKFASIDSTGFTDIVDNGQAIRYGTAVIRFYTPIDYFSGSYIYSNPISITINDVSGNWTDGVRTLTLTKVYYDDIEQYGTWICGVDSGDYSIAHNTTIIQFNGSWTNSYDFSFIEINADGSIFTR